MTDFEMEQYRDACRERDSLKAQRSKDKALIQQLVEAGNKLANQASGDHYYIAGRHLNCDLCNSITAWDALASLQGYGPAGKVDGGVSGAEPPATLSVTSPPRDGSGLSTAIVDAPPHKATEMLGALISVTPGALGEESVDWANTLLDMYTAWAARHGWEARRLAGERALHIQGPVPASLGESETGVHRRVRISPFDGEGRRHTAFAYVAATTVPQAELEELAAIKAKPIDPHGQWGGQIRNYVIDPYKLCKDVRTEHETEDVEGVLDGNIDPFIEAHASTFFKA